MFAMEEDESRIQTDDGSFVPGQPMCAGDCFGFNVTPRKNASPLVTMFVEDDGLWHKKSSFDIHWVDDIITQLTEVKKAFT